MTIIAQLSDPHLAAGADGTVADDSGPVRALRDAVSTLLALPARPDCVVLTGDLTERGLPAEYARLRALLAPLPMPVHPLPGNHDDRAGLRAAFAGHPALNDLPAGPAGPDSPVQYAVEVEGLRLVCCDTTVPGKPHGELDAARLDWLDAALAAAPDTPTVVATHHPPYPIGVRYMDEMRLLDADALGSVLRRHPQVVRLISGHVHRASTGSLGGIIATTCPSTYRQLYLDLSRPGRGAVTGEPAGFALHVLETDDPNGARVTHYVPTGDFRPVVELG